MARNGTNPNTDVTSADSQSEGHVPGARGVEEPRMTRSRAQALANAAADAPQAPLTLENLDERLRLVEDLDGRVDDLEQEISAIGGNTKEMLEDLARQHRIERDMTEDRFRLVQETHEREVTDLRALINELKLECRTHRNTAQAGPAQAPHHPILKAPEPPLFNGTRNAQTVESFIFGIEQYFNSYGVRDDHSRITHAPTYFRDLALLWWRRVLADQERGERQINTWAQFKAELRRHFVPTNAGEEARTRFRRLRQTGSIVDYIREFSSLCLELNDLSDRDALFHFKDGLKEFARLEVNRRNAQTLDEAITIVEGLPDYSSRPSQQPRPKEGNRPRPSFQNREQSRPHKPNHSQSHGQSRDRSKPPNPCYLCGGPHWVRECPKRAKMNAMETQPEKGKEKGKGKVTDKDQASVGSMLRFGALSQPPQTEKEETSETPRQGLLYADIDVYGKIVPAMFDTGASHNFLDVGEAKRLKLRVEGSGGTVKAVNSPALAAVGVAKDVRIQIGDWIGKTDFTVLPMDDFKLVLGLTFFRSGETYCGPTSRVPYEPPLYLGYAIQKGSEELGLLLGHDPRPQRLELLGPTTLTTG
ncbi:PREDICTED: uncharacterized protein LOC109116424, partial [Tarenaya hassleriana]|uniref:uncharacterized protein LOC109116424 n=1 Tax=Tarenaya hassleriana TaxID=28532 RepID=UPI0008FD4924